MLLGVSASSKRNQPSSLLNVSRSHPHGGLPLLVPGGAGPCQAAGHSGADPTGSGAALGSTGGAQVVARAAADLDARHSGIGGSVVGKLVGVTRRERELSTSGGNKELKV